MYNIIKKLSKNILIKYLILHKRFERKQGIRKGKEKLFRLIAVGFGGFTGSILRYSISLKMNERFSESLIPYGTLLVNVVGSFLIGMILELSTYFNMDPI